MPRAHPCCGPREGQGPSQSQEGHSYHTPARLFHEEQLLRTCSIVVCLHLAGKSLSPLDGLPLSSCTWFRWALRVSVIPTGSCHVCLRGGWEEAEATVPHT